MPPRFQKRREFERQRGGGPGGNTSGSNAVAKKGRAPLMAPGGPGLGGVTAPTTSLAPKSNMKEGTPETTEEADWETASESSDPEARKENKEKSSATIGKLDHRKGNKMDRKISGSWAPSSGGGLAQGRNSLGKDSKAESQNIAQNTSQQRFGEKKAPQKNEKNKNGPTGGKGTKAETTVNQVHEIKLDPTMVHQALSEVNNKSKPKQEKANPLEGIDLNNYASK